MELEFYQVDAFTLRPLYGNPAAVVFGGESLSSDLMQRIAREMNLSETVFILPPTRPDAHYRARIFTPMSELPFAGHPTIAASHCVRMRHSNASNLPILRQECGIGIVPIEVLERDAEILLRMTQASPTYKEADLSLADVASMLGCEAADIASTKFEVVSTGVPWLVAELSSVEAISRVRPDQALIHKVTCQLRCAGLTTFAEHSADSATRIRVRTFAPGEGVPEDPVCGSGNGSVAAFLAHHKHGTEAFGSYLAEQGVEIGRDGIVHVSWKRDGEVVSVQIGGHAVVCASGKLHL